MEIDLQPLPDLAPEMFRSDEDDLVSLLLTAAALWHF